MATPQVAVEAQRKRQQVEDAQSVLEPPTSEDVLEDPLAEEDLGEPLIDPLHESARGVQGDTPGDESPDPTPTPGGGDHLNPSSGMAGGAAAIQARGPMAGDAAELREQANKAVQGGTEGAPGKEL